MNCLTTAGGMIAVIQPGGFGSMPLAHLHVTAQAIQERVNPDLRILGAVITNAHRRRKITNQVRAEVGHLYPLLGTIRADAPPLVRDDGGNDSPAHHIKSPRGLRGSRRTVAAGTAMTTPHIRGVTGLLDQILSTAEPKPADFEFNDSSTARLHGRTGSNDCRNVPRVVARRGRPSGKAAAATCKEKVTVRITTDLIAAYRDWSWEARSQLSHLVEQALPAVCSNSSSGYCSSGRIGGHSRSDLLAIT